MPIYCNKCEDVIDREEERTTINGEDLCLHCVDIRNKHAAKLKRYSGTAKKLRHKVKKINCCGELQTCYMYGTDEEVNAAVYMGDLPTIEDCEGYHESAKYRFCLWIETEVSESDDLSQLELILMPYILEEGEWEWEI